MATRKTPAETTLIRAAEVAGTAAGRLAHTIDALRRQSPRTIADARRALEATQAALMALAADAREAAARVAGSTPPANTKSTKASVSPKGTQKTKTTRSKPPAGRTKASPAARTPKGAVTPGLTAAGLVRRQAHAAAQTRRRRAARDNKN